ncbi:MAG: adenosine-specific kinase [Methanobacteriota archaeon]|nr:MAG: adenosine-specific kinase [Euryarchaeota archaeon]
MEIRSIAIENPENLNLVIGQTHFIKSAEDLYEAFIGSAPCMKFGIAFCEASGDCLIRVEGNDDSLKELASKNAMNIGAGHTFIAFMREGFPINVLNAIKDVPEVCNVFTATLNPVDVIVAENERGRGIIGVIDGERSKGIESEEKARERKEFLRKIGYKL